jgi:hypothetical protein
MPYFPSQNNACPPKTPDFPFDGADFPPPGYLFVKLIRETISQPA